MKLEAFEIQRKNQVAILSFNKPDKANSLVERDWEEMKNAIEFLDTDAEVRCIVLAGEGKHFCAGMDISTLMEVGQAPSSDPSEHRHEIKQFILKIQSCISSIEACHKPVLAAIHGACIGGGVDIITACDMRYCSESAYFTIKEVDLGIVADIGTLQRLPRIIHPGIMYELAYTGRKVFAEEAKEIGLVNQTYDSRASLIEAVTAIAENIASKSPLVIKGIKEALLFARDHTIKDSLEQIANYNAAMLLSSDLAEAMSAFMEKRKPVFKDLKH